MAPPALLTKWAADLRSFADLYVKRAVVQEVGTTVQAAPAGGTVIRYGVARHSIELMRLLDDSPRARSHIIFLAQGAMQRKQADKWIRLALVAEALRRHARGRAERLIQVKGQIHRFLARLISAVGEERSHELGEELWNRLLKNAPEAWRTIYNDSVADADARLLDDPVPKAVARALQRSDLELRPLAEALAEMPVRNRGSDDRLKERIMVVQTSLREIERSLWSQLLRQTRWRSPLLILDEAHHLKNEDAGLARQLRAWDSTAELRTGDGAMANAFDRMLFLTATPFQLGHQELVNVLGRFADVRERQPELEDQEALRTRIEALGTALTATQRAALQFQKAWSRLGLPPDRDVEAWWAATRVAAREQLGFAERACVDAFEAVAKARKAAEELLRPWVIRHGKGARWADTEIVRRERQDGARMLDPSRRGGLEIPPDRILPFYLAARSAARPSEDLLGEALSSSFEAFRNTRETRRASKDFEDFPPFDSTDRSHAKWYLNAFDEALAGSAAREHPKIAATVQRVVDLWESGEKVVVFGFYVHTCRALRLHISEALDERLTQAAQRRFAQLSRPDSVSAVQRAIDVAQDRYFDRPTSPGRRALDERLRALIGEIQEQEGGAALREEVGERLQDVMRRFLRARSSLARSFPLERLEDWTHEACVQALLDGTDRSGISWHDKLRQFVHFIATECGESEQDAYLDAVSEIKVGGIRVDDHDAATGSVTALPNVQVAMGETKRETRERLMRAFNTPFFPEILVCSQVMGEGVDLQRHCRHVIHHDLDWNPSTIEQRTGRIDRLGCKAAGRSAIVADLPYIAGASDERQYHVMTERERWFRVVMGEDAVKNLISPDSELHAPLPNAVVEALSFDLSLGGGL
jgi:hypothetical protein